jgi:gamma-glutamyl:cysteine ligase YbdK (ATP-grasp superfamily)
VRAGAALFALVQSLVVWLGERHVSNDLPSPTETWRIEENRWSALIHGTRGQMVDLETGRLKPTDERLHDLLDDLRETADALGNRRQLEDVRAMIDRPNWLRQIDILRAGTARDVVEHLSEEFLSRN